MFFIKMLCFGLFSNLKSRKSRLKTKEEPNGYVQVSILQRSSDAVVSPPKTPACDEGHTPSSNRVQEELPEEPDQQQWSRGPKKIFQCPTCGRVFPRSTALKRHLVIHSGKRPFKCFICGRGFTQGGNLKTHMKIHKGQSLKIKISPPVPVL